MAVPQSFPAKIYQILENESPEIIQWNENGLSFRIVDHARFEREIVPKYFRHNQISSVQRQLNLYGFKCISRGEYKRSFFHPKFRRGDWETVKTLTRYVPVKKNSPPPSQAGDDGSEGGKDTRGGGMHPYMPYMYPYHHSMPANQQLATMMHYGYPMPSNAGSGNGPWSETWNRSSSSSSSPTAAGNMPSSMANGISMYPSHGNVPSASMPQPAYLSAPSNIYNNNLPSPRPMGDSLSPTGNMAPSAMSHDPSMVAATAAAASHYGGPGTASMDLHGRVDNHMGASGGAVHAQPAPFAPALPRENFKPPMPPAMMLPVQPPLQRAYTAQQSLGGSSPTSMANAMKGGVPAPARSVPFSRPASSGNLPMGGDYDLMVEFGMFDSFAIPESLGNSQNGSVVPTAAPSVVNLPAQLLPAAGNSSPRVGADSAASNAGAALLLRAPGPVIANPAALQCHELSPSSASSPSQASSAVTTSTARLPSGGAVLRDVSCNTELTYDPATDSFVRRSDL